MILNGVISTSLEKLVLDSPNESANAPISDGTDITPPVPFQK